MSRILVVDDEPLLVDLLVGELTAAGYECTGVESAEAALKPLSAATFDLVICDHRMPGMTGTELAARLRGNSGAEAPLFILLSGYYASPRLQQLPAGVDLLMPKPWEFDHLLSAVSDLLSHRGRMTANL